MDSLISTDALAALLGEPDLVVLDASLHLPDTGRDAHAEYLAGHVPGARLLDLDHALPAPDRFAAELRAAGVRADSRVVVYDDSAIRSAARAWFLLRRLAGHLRAAVLDGGLGRWRAQGRPLARGEEPAPPPGDIVVRWDADLLRDKAAMLANVAHASEQVLDARSEARFHGTAPEPRAGVAPGSIPGSVNLPYTALFNADGTYRDVPGLRREFAIRQVDLARPIVTTCGSGITACALAFALDRLGVDDVALYDGSWAEWGADPATPKALPIAVGGA